jgi:BMFP domain-containing protein YqiC
MADSSNRLNLDDLAGRLAEAVPQNLKAIGEDLERNVKSLLQTGLAKMDLVTRDEFDVQVAVLARTRERLEALEARLAKLQDPPPD